MLTFADRLSRYRTKRVQRIEVDGFSSRTK